MKTSHREPLPGTEVPALIPAPAMPGGRLRLRLKTSPALRRALPTPLVVARSERKARRLYDRHQPTREHALRTMEAVVCATERASELEQLARRYVVEAEAWEALFWQPWREPPSIDRASRELLRECCSGERGALLSACHVGPFFGKARALVSIGIEPVVVAGDWWFEPPGPGYWGRRLARWRRGLPRLPLVRPSGSFDLLASLLRDGAATMVYFDLPGRHETRFLGKPVELVDGTARLAVAADVPVVPLRSRRRGHRQSLQAGEPLDPRDHGGVDEVQDALARIHERLILEAPEEMNDPAEFGWKDQASATAWRRPPAGRGTDAPVASGAAPAG
jgi:lauroyl/myristoyl acyltransferase